MGRAARRKHQNRNRTTASQSQTTPSQTNLNQAFEDVTAAGVPPEIAARLLSRYQEQERQDSQRQHRRTRLQKGDSSGWDTASAAVVGQLAQLTEAVLSAGNAAEYTEPELQQIGRDLHRLGGKSLMERTLEEIVPRPLQREVEFFWDGIGDWRA